MNVEKEIIRVLAEVGHSGLSIRKISIHVYNSRNSFFEDVPFEHIYNNVKQFLFRNSRKPGSIIEKTEQRGVYRLNTETEATRQLMFCFEKDDIQGDNADNSHTSEDHSLSLF